MAVKISQRAVRGRAKVSVAALDRERRRRQKAASQLEAKRSRLLSKVADLEREIQGLGGSVNGTGHRNAGRLRGGRTTTLPQALASLLKGRTMSMTDATEAVQRAGYTSNSKNFRTIVNAALLNNTDLFKRVGWGKYTAR